MPLKTNFLILFFITCFGTIAHAQDNPWFPPPINEEEKPYKIISIFFDGGSYYIYNDEKDKVIQFLSENILENYEIHIHSHTDNIGGKEYNLWLSKMRSTAAYDMLIKEGFPIDRVFIKDHGFFNPTYDNDTWEGRIKNRRVDIVLWPLPV